MRHCTPIRKAVIPAAGMGTRLLPITKAVPKEMLPIGCKPLIQYAVEEAAASGLETVILVVGPGKKLLAEYFQGNPTLEDLLFQQGREADAEALRNLAALADIRTAWQDSPRGLAHAIACARSEIGDESFVVILPDVLIDSKVPCARQLIDCYENHPGCVIATREVDASEVERFGILDVIPMHDTPGSGRVLQVISLTERPEPESVISRYGIFGRYVLPPAIFTCIDQIRPGCTGEIQLTDALMNYSHYGAVYGFCFEGTHYDAGDELGFLQATIDYALKQPGLSDRLHQHLARRDPMTVPAQ